jgi:hypothetical protein
MCVCESLIRLVFEPSYLEGKAALFSRGLFYLQEPRLSGPPADPAPGPDHENDVIRHEQPIEIGVSGYLYTTPPPG